MRPLPKSFFEQPTTKVARNLLGLLLVHKTKEGTTIGKIVETEAYIANDPASHAFNGKTRRNEAMFAPAGCAYIYFIYGNHYCFNVVTAPEGIGEAVLIRALEPLSGSKIMKKRRKTQNILQLCSGPAKLVQALGITKEQNFQDLTSSDLKITLPAKNEKFAIVQTKRIGITKGAELPYRFYIKSNKFVPGK